MTGGTASARRSEIRQRQKLVGVRMTPGEHGLLTAEAKRTRKSEAALLRDAFLATLPESALAGIERSCPPVPVVTHLRNENERRANAAGQRDAGSATMILARFGDLVPPDQRRVAEARIAAPAAPWSDIAAQLGMTKHAAIGKFRRMLQAARAQLEAT